MNLSTDRLYVIVILGKEVPKIFEDVDLLEHSVIDGELLTEGECRADRYIPLVPPFRPGAAFFGVYMRRV